MYIFNVVIGSLNIRLLGMSAGENKHCIEAVKLAGDRFQFNDIYKEIKGFFGGHINTTA